MPLFDLHATSFDPENPSLDYGSTTQVIAANSDQLALVGGLLKLSSVANRALSGVQTIVTGNAKAGDIVTLFNTNAANTISFAWGPVTKLKLGASPRVLSTGGSITLLFDGTYWIEIGFTTTAAIA